MRDYLAFTLRADGGLLRVLQTHCDICPAFDPQTLPKDRWPQMHRWQAIWDTGATGSVVTDAVIQACGLKPIAMTQVHGVHGVAMTEQYLINLGLPNGVGFHQVLVTRGQLPPDAHALIGMDIISRGDFAISSRKGSTVFSFRIPSIDTIDFVEQQNNNRFKGASPAEIQARMKKKRR